MEARTIGPDHSICVDGLLRNRQAPRGYAWATDMETWMPDTPVKEHMEVIGADGVHIGTVDALKMAGLNWRKPTAVKAGTRGTIISST
jgi:hypothetical protein